MGRSLRRYNPKKGNFSILPNPMQLGIIEPEQCQALKSITYESSQKRVRWLRQSEGLD